jgi:hypothetical protein
MFDNVGECFLFKVTNSALLNSAVDAIMAFASPTP